MSMPAVWFLDQEWKGGWKRTRTGLDGGKGGIV